MKRLDELTPALARLVRDLYHEPNLSNREMADRDCTTPSAIRQRKYRLRKIGLMPNAISKLARSRGDNRRTQPGLFSPEAGG